MITFHSVTKRFGEGQPAVEDVSFHVDAGEFLFLTGHSGSGKTTLLKLLTKEYIPTEGDIEFQGELLSNMRGSQIHNHRRSIGVVFQDYRLLSDLNVWENIALALQIIGKKEAEIEERVTDLLELVQLTDKAYHFPNQLSGGESQRIGIARALATAPSVLLADEPTGNLDPQNTLMIARLFDRINQLGTTVLFATHDTNILSALAHRRLVFEKGRLISDSGQSSQHKNKTKVKVEVVAKPTQSTQPSQPKKPLFRLPRLSLPFGKKKAAMGAPTPERTDEKENKEAAPLIQQEDLDGKAPAVKSDDKKIKKPPETIIAVETLPTLLKDKKEKP